VLTELRLLPSHGNQEQGAVSPNEMTQFQKKAPGSRKTHPGQGSLFGLYAGVYAFEEAQEEVTHFLRGL
jgi:hypothetical protein